MKDFDGGRGNAKYQGQLQEHALNPSSVVMILTESNFSFPSFLVRCWYRVAATGVRLLFELEKVLVVDTVGSVVQDGVPLFKTRSGALGWGGLAVSYA